MTIKELIERLQEFPEGWHVYATKAGSSLEVWNPDGVQYAYVFTDDREPRHFKLSRPKSRITLSDDDVVL